MTIESSWNFPWIKDDLPWLCCYLPEGTIFSTWGRPLKKPTWLGGFSSAFHVTWGPCSNCGICRKSWTRIDPWCSIEKKEHINSASTCFYHCFSTFQKIQQVYTVCITFMLPFLFLRCHPGTALKNAHLKVADHFPINASIFLWDVQSYGPFIKQSTQKYPNISIQKTKLHVMSWVDTLL